jgi:hypothetical protein
MAQDPLNLLASHEMFLRGRDATCGASVVVNSRRTTIPGWFRNDTSTHFAVIRVCRCVGRRRSDVAQRGSNPERSARTNLRDGCGGMAMRIGIRGRIKAAGLPALDAAGDVLCRCPLTTRANRRFPATERPTFDKGCEIAASAYRRGQSGSTQRHSDTTCAAMCRVAVSGNRRVARGNCQRRGPIEAAALNRHEGKCAKRGDLRQDCLIPQDRHIGSWRGPYGLVKVMTMLTMVVSYQSDSSRPQPTAKSTTSPADTVESSSARPLSPRPSRLANQTGSP